MELLELMKRRRSIRKYQDRQISKADLETILQAGTYAPNAGGGQRSMIVGVRSAARGEETFDNESGAAMLRAWGVPENYVARCFVLLGYVDGEYPGEKPRKAGRSKIVEG